MTRSLSLALIAAAYAVIAACAPAPAAYGPASASSSGIGYDQVRIEDNRWRISYTAGSRATPAEAERLALRRASEITLQHGYEWFTIADRLIEQEGDQQSPVRVGGSLGQTFGSRGYRGTSVGVGVAISPGREQRTIVRMEIRTGSGPERPEGAYDAAMMLGAPPL